jgi:hypothetical protein
VTDGLHPTDKGRLKLFRVKVGQDPLEGIGRGNAIRPLF